MVEQASQAAAEGGKEIVLTGVNIGDFGKSTGETFFDLGEGAGRGGRHLSVTAYPPSSRIC